MIKKTVLVLTLCLILALTACSGKKDAVEDKIVAVVDSRNITLSELNNRVSQEASANGIDFSSDEFAPYRDYFNEQVLDVMISEILLEAEAQKQGIEVPQEELEAEFAMMKNSFANEADYKTYLENMKLNEEEMKERIKKHLLIQIMYEKMTAEVAVEDEEVRAHYENNAADYSSEEQIRAAHVLLETKEKAEEVLERVQNGADIGQEAFLHSIDPSAKSNRGDLGYFGRGMMVPDFEAAAFSLGEGEIYPEPVQTQFGFHVIQVFEKLTAEKRSFAEVESEIRADLLNEKKYNEFENRLRELKNNVNIENTL